MQILLNGNQEILEKEISVSEFLLSKGLNPETIVVQHNEKILKNNERSSAMLQDHDRLEVLNFVGGG